MERPNHGLANATRKAALAPAVARAHDFEVPPAELLALQAVLLFEAAGAATQHDSPGMGSPADVDV